ncbi:RNA methyltransferase [bacterium]|nr:RNA methyltransferase [bacterium]
MTLLTSRQNPKIKQIRQLSKRKYRQEQGLFVVEGIRHVGEAIEAHADLEYLLYAPELLESDFAYSLITQLEETDTPVFSTTPDIFSSLAGKENPQGILAVARHHAKPLSSLTPENLHWGVVIDAPQDPGNLGTILRTLDSAGGDGLIVLGNATDITHPTAVRASMGTIFWQPVVTATIEEFIEWQNLHHFHLYGSSAHGTVDYKAVEYQAPALLMLGSERAGMDKRLIPICDQVLRLPMHGRATSLNLSVAAGILIYEMQHHLTNPS